MPNRTRIAPRIRQDIRQDDRWRVPLPHPSWSSEVAIPDRVQPILPAEFWKRLGL